MYHSAFPVQKGLSWRIANFKFTDTLEIVSSKLFIRKLTFQRCGVCKVDMSCLSDRRSDNQALCAWKLIVVNERTTFHRTICGRNNCVMGHWMQSIHRTDIIAFVETINKFFVNKLFVNKLFVNKLFVNKLFVNKAFLDSKGPMLNQ